MTSNVIIDCWVIDTLQTNPVLLLPLHLWNSWSRRSQPCHLWAMIFLMQLNICMWKHNLLNLRILAKHTILMLVVRWQKLLLVFNVSLSLLLLNNQILVAPLRVMIRCIFVTNIQCLDLHWPYLSIYCSVVLHVARRDRVKTGARKNVIHVNCRHLCVPCKLCKVLTTL